jgi:hypothetical protein
VPFIPLPDAAERLKLSESTIRRKIKRGELRAQQEETIQGYRWLVEVPDQDGGQVGTAGDHVPTASDQVATTLQPSSNIQQLPQEKSDQVSASSDQVRTIDPQVITSGDQVPTTELFQELRRLHDQNVQLAGQVGFLQAQLQQAQEQVKFLTDSQHTPEQPAPEAEPAPQPAEPTKRVPWWKRLFTEI